MFVTKFRFCASLLSLPLAILVTPAIAAAPGKVKQKTANAPAANKVVRYEGASGDWAYRCVFPGANTAQPPQMCSMEQALMLDKGKGSTPERLGGVFLVRLPPAKGKAATPTWRLNLMTPLGTSLQEPA